MFDARENLPSELAGACESQFVTGGAFTNETPWTDRDLSSFRAPTGTDLFDVQDSFARWLIGARPGGYELYEQAAKDFTDFSPAPTFTPTTGQIERRVRDCLDRTNLLEPAKKGMLHVCVKILTELLNRPGF